MLAPHHWHGVLNHGKVILAGRMSWVQQQLNVRYRADLHTTAYEQCEMKKCGESSDFEFLFCHPSLSWSAVFSGQATQAQILMKF